MKPYLLVSRPNASVIIEFAAAKAAGFSIHIAVEGPHVQIIARGSKPKEQVLLFNTIDLPDHDDNDD